MQDFDDPTRQPSFEVVVEKHESEEKLRPVFVPNGSTQRSWVGEWETSTADLARQVAREFQRWLEL